MLHPLRYLGVSNWPQSFLLQSGTSDLITSFRLSQVRPQDPKCLETPFPGGQDSLVSSDRWWEAGMGTGEGMADFKCSYQSFQV